MPYPTLLRSVRIFMALLAGLVSARAQLLYDAAAGTQPSSQGWAYSSNPLAPAPFITVTNSILFLDSTAANSTQAGYGRAAPVDLNRTNGWAVTFSLRLDAESHTGNANRAGFSLITLGADKKGVEIGFWTTSVWAQADSPLFTRAENAAVNTTAAFTDFTVAVGRTNYVLYTNSVAVLSGPVRDYTAFVGVIDPYETPNFLFFGDNTGSAQAAWRLRNLSLVLPPAVIVTRPGILRWSGVSNVTYSVDASTNFTTWTRAASVTSATEQFAWTNNAATSARFFRVRFP